ncbi:hypothetical protein J22TS3_05380 [Paenibacillus sp. J22TS3]|nr:hypothetical protein J22TS3_05380 [Paenibacillus sp. J22TS3]
MSCFGGDPQIAAWAASKTKGTRLASFFYRIQKRRGQKKATIAAAHLILRIIYRMLKDKIPYREVGWDYITSSTSSVEYWIKKIEAQGFNEKRESTEAS